MSTIIVTRSPRDSDHIELQRGVDEDRWQDTEVLEWTDQVVITLSPAQAMELIKELASELYEMAQNDRL